MYLIKYLVLLIVCALQITTFSIAAEKFITTNNKKEKIKYLIITITGLSGFIFLTNLAIFLI